MTPVAPCAASVAGRSHYRISSPRHHDNERQGQAAFRRGPVATFIQDDPPILTLFEPACRTCQVLRVLAGWKRPDRSRFWAHPIARSRPPGRHTAARSLAAPRLTDSRTADNSWSARHRPARWHRRQASLAARLVAIATVGRLLARKRVFEDHHDCTFLRARRRVARAWRDVDRGSSNSPDRGTGVATVTSLSALFVRRM